MKLYVQLQHICYSTFPGHIGSRISNRKYDQVSFLCKPLSADNAHGLGNNMLCGILLISFQRCNAPYKLKSMQNRIIGSDSINRSFRSEIGNQSGCSSSKGRSHNGLGLQISCSLHCCQSHSAGHSALTTHIAVMGISHNSGEALWSVQSPPSSSVLPADIYQLQSHRKA